MSRISIDTTSGRLAGRYLEPAGGPGDRAVLLVHGWTSEAQAGYLDLPDRLAEQGFAALAIDLPGHGESEGDHSRLGYREFIGAATDAADDLMRRSGCRRLSIVGTSLGGFLAARVAGIREVDSLVLWVPADFSERLVGSGAPVDGTALSEQALAWRSQPHGPGESGALQALADFDGKVLILEAADDELVPHQTIANYLSAAVGADHIVLSGATHSLRSQPDKHALAMGFTLTWLSTREEAPETPNILGALARIYVDDIDAALPFYRALCAPDEPHRFAYRGMRLAKAGAFLLVEGADDRARSHAASIAVRHIDEVVRAVNDGEGTVLDGPAPGPNGSRLVARHPDGAVVEYVEVG